MGGDSIAMLVLAWRLGTTPYPEGLGYPVNQVRGMHGKWKTQAEQQYPQATIAPWPPVRVGDSCRFPRDTTEKR